MSEMTQKTLDRLEKEICDWQFFEDFNEEEIRSTIHMMSMHHIMNEEVIFREKDPGDYLFLILEGKVEIAVTSNSMNRIIAVLEPGAVVGEMAMLDDSTRSATAKASHDSEILILTKDKLYQLIDTNPVLAAKVFRQLGKILAVRLRGMVGNLAEIS